MKLRFAGFLVLLGASLVARAEDAPYPEEVKAFIAERDTCDHFRGEPFEGDSPGAPGVRIVVVLPDFD